VGKRVKLYYAVDVLIGIAFVLAAVTGVAFLAMGSGGYQGGRNPEFSTSLLGIERDLWNDAHTWASFAMIAGVGLHLLLHWKWILHTTMRVLRAGRGASRA